MLFRASCLVVILSSAGTLSVRGQARFLNFTSKDGLSSNNVLAIIQDSNGYMWFGTENGLDRFDGAHTAVYKRGDIPDNLVTSLAEDSGKNLWIGTANGLCVLSESAGKPGPSFISHMFGNHRNCVRAIYADNDGFVWAAYFDGWLEKMRYDASSRKIETIKTARYGIGKVEGEYYYQQIFEDSAGKIWLGGRLVPSQVIDNKTRMRPLATRISRSIGSYAESHDGALYGFDDYLSVLTEYDSRAGSFKDICKLPVSHARLLMDRKSRLWAAGSYGLALVSPKDKKSKLFSHDKDDPWSVSSEELNCIYEDRSGNIWVGGDNGASMLSEILNVVKSYSRKNGGTASDNITALMQDRDGLLWIGTSDNGAETLDIPTGECGSIKYHLIGTRLDPATREREKFVLHQYRIFGRASGPSREDNVSCLYQDAAGKIYIGLWAMAGFNVYDKNTKRIRRYALYGDMAGDNCNILPANLFGSNWYVGFLEDRRGVFWCATWEGEGLNEFDRGKGRFTGKSYINRAMMPTFIDDATFVSTGNRIYMARGDYYGYYDIVSRKFTQFAQELPADFPNREIINMYYDYLSPTCLKLPMHSHDYKIANAGAGKIAISTDLGIFIHDTANGKITKAENGKKYNFTQRHRWPISNREQFVCSSAGLCLMDNVTGNSFIMRDKDDYSVSSRLASCLMEDSHGHIWYGTTEAGVNVIDPVSDRVLRYSFRESDENSIPDNNVTCLKEDRSGNIWIGTKKGLYKIRASSVPVIGGKGIWAEYGSEKFRSFNTASIGKRVASLQGLQIMSLEEDKSGRLWISSNEGLYFLDQGRKEDDGFVRVAHDFGFQSDIYSERVSCTLHDGSLAFGGKEGFNIFNPDSLVSKVSFPKVLVSNFRYGNHVIAELAPGKKLGTLKNSENDISFDFASTDYATGGFIKYRYRLEGEDRQWNYAQFPSLSAHYSNLPPGAYDLVIQCSDSFGRWPKEGKVDEFFVRLRVLPPLMLSWPFMSSYAILLFLAVFAIVKFREMKLRKEKEELEATVSARTRELKEEIDTKNNFFSIIAHDVKNPVIGTKYLTDALMKHFDSMDKSSIKSALNEISTASAHTADMLNSLLLWALSQKDIIRPDFNDWPLRKIAEEACNGVQEQAAAKKTLITMEIGPDCIISTDKNLLVTVMRNLLSNAIKFTEPGGKISISATIGENETSLSIKDNGVGMSQATLARLFRIDSKISANGTAGEKGTGLGLIIVKELLDKMKESIFVQSAEGEGSVFTISLAKPDTEK